MKKIQLLTAMLLISCTLAIATSCGRGTSKNEEAVNAEDTQEINEHAFAQEEIEIAATGEPTASEPVSITPLTLDDILEMANTRREGIIKPSEDIAAALVQGREPPTIDVSQFFNEVSAAQIISGNDAIYDAQIFFDITRQVYGAYTYFGGDEVFLPIFKYVLDRLSTQDYWQLDDFSALLFDSLYPVISDNHFIIHGRRLGVNHNFYVSDTAFERSENGLRNIETGLYVAEAVGHDLDKLFRLAMNDSGKFYYIPIVVRPEFLSEYNLTLVYECGDNQALTLRRHNPSRRNFQPVSLARRAHNIPLVTIMSMGFPTSTYGSGSRDARRFLSIAEELRDEPVIIVDIRSNGGGNGILHRQWLHILTGEIVPGNYFGMRVNNYDTFRETVINSPYDSWFFNPIDLLDTYYPRIPFGDYHILSHTLPNRIIENDQLIILLTDRFVASAGDAFADAMLNMENTLIIGQNTGGVLHTDLTYSPLFLPNSGLRFGLGRTIHLHPEGHLQEGIGVAPDIWFTGNFIITAILNMLEEHTLIF